VDDNGHFVLANVPTGHVELHFMGNGTDALLGLDGVAEHATLTITVRVSGHDAHLEPGGDDHGSGQQNEVELNGIIASGSLAGSCAGHNLSFMVGTTKVTTNASTQFHAASCQQLKAGNHVELKGTRQTDGSVLATSVQGDGEDQKPEDHNVELKGAIATGSIAGACASHSLSFKVGTTMVKTNAATRFKDTACASLRAGDSVEVKGTRQTDGSVLATSVEGDGEKPERIQP
jgi:cytochrome c-type biogenesis protein CcmE